MIDINRIINGHSPKSPRSIPKPETAEMKRSAAASQEKNQKTHRSKEPISQID